MDQAEIELATGERAIVDACWIALYLTDPDKVKVAGSDAKLVRWIREPQITVETNCPMLDDDDTHDVGEFYAQELKFLLERAARDGVVITVETVPVEPLAMRNYRIVGNVRGAR